MDFKSKVAKQSRLTNSLLCIGLDPDPAKVKADDIFTFNKNIIKNTKDLACAYKPNIAFYEAYGLAGHKALEKTIIFLKKNFPRIPIILDAKRADIPNTAKMYAKAAFEVWDADAVTVYPHLGLDSIEPFLKYKNKLTILILKTSNPDSNMFFNLKTKNGLFYLAVSKEILKHDKTNIGIFCGATYPRELKLLRSLFPQKVFLSAGLGTQGADVKEAVKAGIDKDGQNIMFNESRSIIFSANPETAAKKRRDEINEYR